MRWASETRPDPESEGWLIGDAIEVSEDAEFSGTPFKVKVGDAVYLTGVRKGAPAEIQLVEELFEDAREQSKKKGFIWMQTAAFWRPEKMKIPDEIAWHAKELFPAMRDGETLTCDNSPGKFLELTRVHVSRCDDPAKFEDADHTFFYNKSFDPKACALFALVLRAGQRWSPQTHALFPVASRARAVELLLIGHRLSREPRFEAVAGGLLDAWMAAVVPHAVQR